MKVRATDKLPHTKKTNSMYAIDPPMKHYVHVKKTFPGAFI